MKIIILLGPPGAGKGTITNYLLDNYKSANVSVGDLLREAQLKGDEIAKQIKDTIQQGLMVSNDIVSAVIKTKLNEIAEEETKELLIFDGYPRTVEQLQTLDKILLDTKQHLFMSLYLNCDEDLLVKRISGRFICKDCNAIYNTYFKPTIKKNICDSCGGSNFFTREDDKEKIVKSRVLAYKEQTQPLINIFKERGVLQEIYANNEIDKITKEVSHYLEQSK